MSKHIWHSFIALALLISHFYHIEAVSCPGRCKCSWILDSLEVNCAKNGLIEYPQFDAMPIEHVDLSGNYFVEFPTHLSNYDSLIYLDLSNNQIEYLDSDALLGFNALRTLILANNTITRWLNLNPNSAFLNAISLQRLVLSGNPLETFNMDNHEQVIISESLTHLELENCGITKAGGDLLVQNMPNLERLNLNKNPLGSLNTLPSKSLRVLELSSCNLQRIPSSLMAGLPALEYLELSWNTALQVGSADLPAGMRSDTLKKLDLSYCRLSALSNTTFQHFPELAQLKLNGNRFTNPFPREYFQSNKYLDAIWAGDNTWICNCQDPTFIEFYDFLTAAPTRLKDRNSLRCASPTYNYGKTWQAACERDWVHQGRSSNAEKVWYTIMFCILAIGVLIFLFTCFQKYMALRRKRLDREEYQRNQDEMREIRRLNQRILEEEARPNAPNSFENALPSYEDALRMPKPVRPVKSMLDLTEETSRRRRRLKKNRTNPEEDIAEEDDPDIQYDYRNRFRSEEMLSNRDIERVQQIGPNRRTGRITHNNSGSRRFSIEDSRFPAAHLKSQNLQSAEQIGNFQSYENSPYTKRKPKIAEIPPFKRANLRADSVEFLTDPEYEANSKPSSPFARRKPKAPSPTSTPLAPAVEDYFGTKSKTSDSPDSSDFHVVIEPEIQSLKDVNYDDSSSSGASNADEELIKGKRKKLRNSSSRRASGSFIAAAATAAASGETSEEEPVVVVHRPMRETLF